jgi:hypothetical protein
MWSNAYAERWVRTARSECTGSAAAARTNGTWALTGTDTEANPVSDDDLGGGDQSVAVAGNGSAIVAGARAANGQTGQVEVFPVS